MLKPLSSLATTEVVWPADPAFDPESDFTGWAEAMHQKPGQWRDFLKVKNGEKPTIFKIGVVPSSDIHQIMREAGGSLDSSLAFAFFKISVRDILGFPCDARVDAYGQTVEGPPKVKDSLGDEIVDPKWIERTFCRNLRDVGIYVGMAAWIWQRFSEEDAKN